MSVDPSANFIRLTTTASVASGDTTLDVSSASDLIDPSVDGAYNVVLWDSANNPRPDQDPNVEIVRVTAIDTTNDTATVTRAQENTSAVSHPSGSAIQIAPTAKDFTDINNGLTNAIVPRNVSTEPTVDSSQSNPLAIGDSAEANDDFALAIGPQASALDSGNEGPVAIGAKTSASGLRSTALGYESECGQNGNTAGQSVALGGGKINNSAGGSVAMPTGEVDGLSFATVAFPGATDSGNFNAVGFPSSNTQANSAVAFPNVTASGASSIAIGSDNTLDNVFRTSASLWVSGTDRVTSTDLNNSEFTLYIESGSLKARIQDGSGNGGTFELGDVNGDLTVSNQINAGTLSVSDQGSSVYLSSNQTGIASGTFVTVQYDTENYDDRGEYDQSTYQFTATDAGTYAIKASVQWGDFTGAEIAIQVLVNGSARSFTSRSQDSSFSTIGSTLIFDLSAGDTVSVEARQSSGTTQDIIGSQSATNFTVSRIG